MTQRSKNAAPDEWSAPQRGLGLPLHALGDGTQNAASGQRRNESGHTRRALRWCALTRAGEVSCGTRARALGAARRPSFPKPRIVANSQSRYKDFWRTQPTIRFGSFPNRLTVRISGSHPGDRGSIPRSGAQLPEL